MGRRAGTIFKLGGGSKSKIKFYHDTLIFTQPLEIALIVNAITGVKVMAMT